MAHLAGEDRLRKRGLKKSVGPILNPGATTELGTSLKTHTMEDVGLGLRVLAYNGSNYSRSSALLQSEYDVKVHAATLRKWATVSFAQRYAEIQKELDTDISNKLSGRLTDAAVLATETQIEIINELADNITDLEPNELAPAARNLSQVSTPAIEKAQLLRGKPTDRTETRDASKLMAKLVEMGLVKNPGNLNLQEEEIEEAEVVEEATDQDHHLEE